MNYFKYATVRWGYEHFPGKYLSVKAYISVYISHNVTELLAVWPTESSFGGGIAVHSPSE